MLHLFLMVLACVLFLIAGVLPNVGTPRVNLVALGLFCWALAATVVIAR